MDNRIFNVNGESKEQLIKTMELAFMTQYDKPKTAASWIFDKEKGLIFNWAWSSDHNKGFNNFPIPLDATKASQMAWDWLQGKDSESMDYNGFDRDSDHDGHNSKGFRVYCEDWGHVGENRYSIVAIRPVYTWYGK